MPLSIVLLGAAGGQRLSGQKGKTEAVPPQMLEEILGILSNNEEFVLLHHREHPDGERHGLVPKQHQTGL